MAAAIIGLVLELIRATALCGIGVSPPGSVTPTAATLTSDPCSTPTIAPGTSPASTRADSGGQLLGMHASMMTRALAGEWSPGVRRAVQSDSRHSCPVVQVNVPSVLVRGPSHHPVVACSSTQDARMRNRIWNCAVGDVAVTDDALGRRLRVVGCPVLLQVGDVYVAVGAKATTCVSRRCPEGATTPGERDQYGILLRHAAPAGPQSSGRGGASRLLFRAS